MRRALAGLSLIVAASLGAGCGPKDNRTVLHFWAMGSEGEIVGALIPEFERLHPEIHVEVEQLPWTAAHEKLLTAVAGDSTPDLCQLGNSWIPEFVVLKALAPLQQRIDASTTITRADYFSGIWDSNVVGGAIYGVPWYVDTRLLFYRSDLIAAAGFAAPPTSWGQWLEVLAAIKASSHGERFGILLPLNEYDPLIALALQQQQPMLRDNGTRGNFASKDFERTFGFYVEMFRQHYAPSVRDSAISNVWTEFGRGYFAFYVSGPWNIGEFRRRLPASLDGKWMTAPLPGPDGPGASIAGGSSLAVFRGSKHADAAWQLIEFLSQPAVQQRFHAMTGNLPARRSAWAAAEIAADPTTRAFRDQLERVQPRPKVAEWERIATEMQLMTERVVRGDLSVHEGAVELDARTDAILAKRRQLLAEGAVL
ncbi:MAG TPA: sugar ABC transporter substrate-binding protein [Steroidobacteraceae bacterium]|nr:sugar ABC transporter substrate-binding protein [Steroidobacteraceae bacterium]